MAVRANYDDIVMISVIGEIASPRSDAASPYTVTYDGQAPTLTRSGGITYNVRVGDRAIGWAADHTEPGVTIRNKDQQENASLSTLSCIGNDAFVVSGEARGAKGTVSGKHGSNLLVDFTLEIMEKLTIGDKIQVRGYGCGLRLLDAPQVKLISMSAQLLRVLPLEIADGVVSVPVAGIVPPELMGAGVGQPSPNVDYDIQTADGETLAQHGLANLRLGDLVALRDQDNSFRHGYRKGAWAIASVSHADSIMGGHGPGVSTLMASPTGHIRPYLAPEKANIADLLGLRKPA